MNLSVARASLEEVRPFRELFLKEANFQFVYNKCHGAGWADVYNFHVDEAPVGYGAVWGKDRREDRDSIFEFYLLPPWRKRANTVFSRLAAASGARYVEAQSNDILLASMLYEHARDVNAEAILFENSHETSLVVAGAQFVRRGEEYAIEVNGEVAATGGYVYNYNFPFIDMYYEVKEPFRRLGIASYFVQELKREAYRQNRVPAARCNIHNLASKLTLLKGGMRVCGFILTGEISR